MHNTIPTNSAHHIRQSFNPRYRSRSAAGRDRKDLFQVMPSTCTFGGGFVAREITIITNMQKIHAPKARWLKVLYSPSSLNRNRAQLKANPATIVVTAAAALARFQRIPRVKITANGGAMKKNTVWIFSNSVVCVVVK